MSRKKHTHQTKSEAHADEVVLASNATDGAEGAEGAAKDGEKPIEAQTRIQKLLKSAEELAKTRLSGTRVELLMDGLPARLDKAFDAALDRLGLVRKSKLPGAARAEEAQASAGEPAPAQ